MRHQFTRRNSCSTRYFGRFDHAGHRHDVCISKPAVRFVGNGGPGARSAPGYEPNLSRAVFSPPACQVRQTHSLEILRKAHTRGGVPAKICIPARENLSRSSRNALQPMPPPRVSFFALNRILRIPPCPSAETDRPLSSWRKLKRPNGFSIVLEQSTRLPQMTSVLPSRK